MHPFDLVLIDSLERIMGKRDSEGEREREKCRQRDRERERRHFTQASVGLRPQPQVPIFALFLSQLY